MTSLKNKSQSPGFLKRRIKIIRLTGVSKKSFNDLGSGYVSDKIFHPLLERTKSTYTFKLRLKKLHTSYQKKWPVTASEIHHYNLLIKKKSSFGAYDKKALTGFIICEYRKWNNTLFIENLLVRENYRRQGIGSRLLQAAVAHAKKNKIRLIELETQNTNVPAIRFYENEGFKITGLNLKLYDKQRDEIGLFLSKEI